MLKTQRTIWLPILVGVVFFTVGGFLHIVEHSFYESAEIALLHEISVVAGLSAFVIGVLHYSQMQTDYHKLKSKVLARVQFEETLQDKEQVA
jgi:spore maturation protein SpmA